MTSAEQEEGKMSTLELNEPIRDWLLELLVGLVNTTPLEIGITLNVRGTMVSGLLIGGKTYLEGFADEYRTGFAGTGLFDQEFLDKLESSFKEMGDKIYSKEAGSEEDGDEYILTFIHLKNARIFAPGCQPIPENRGVWWRGRLDSVDGFFLGNFS